jgi:hypothetical protein
MNDGNGVPFWPEADFAESCATGDWQNYLPRKIPLDVFVLKLLPGMHQDDKAAAIFPTPSNKGWIVSATTLTSDIEEEMRQYE